MSERSPSLMTPGQFEPRRPQRADPVGSSEAVYATPEATPRGTLGVTSAATCSLPEGYSRPASRADRSAAEWPFWVRAALAIGLLLAATIAVMWGASVAK